VFHLVTQKQKQKQKQKHSKNTKQLFFHCPAAAEWGVPPCQTHRKRKKQKQNKKLSLSSCRIRCFKYILLHYQTHTHTEGKRLGHLVRDTEHTSEKREKLFRSTKGGEDK